MVDELNDPVDGLRVRVASMELFVSDDGVNKSAKKAARLHLARATFGAVVNREEYYGSKTRKTKDLHPEDVRDLRRMVRVPIENAPEILWNHMGTELIQTLLVCLSGAQKEPRWEVDALKNRIITLNLLLACPEMPAQPIRDTLNELAHMESPRNTLLTGKLPKSSLAMGLIVAAQKLAPWFMLRDAIIKHDFSPFLRVTWTQAEKQAGHTAAPLGEPACSEFVVLHHQDVLEEILWTGFTDRALRSYSFRMSNQEKRAMKQQDGGWAIGRNFDTVKQESADDGTPTYRAAISMEDKKNSAAEAMISLSGPPPDKPFGQQTPGGARPRDPRRRPASQPSHTITSADVQQAQPAVKPEPKQPSRQQVESLKAAAAVLVRQPSPVVRWWEQRDNQPVVPQPGHSAVHRESADPGQASEQRQSVDNRPGILRPPTLVLSDDSDCSKQVTFGPNQVQIMSPARSHSSDLEWNGPAIREFTDRIMREEEEKRVEEEMKRLAQEPAPWQTAIPAVPQHQLLFENEGPILMVDHFGNATHVHGPGGQVAPIDDFSAMWQQAMPAVPQEIRCHATQHTFVPNTDGNAPELFVDSVEGGQTIYARETAV